MSSLSLLTTGYLPNRTPLSIVTHGRLAGEEIEPEPEAGGGGVYRQAFSAVRKDIIDRDYRLEGKQGKKSVEITPKKVLREVQKAVLKAKVVEIAKSVGITQKAARELLEVRAQIEITRLRLERIEQLNQQTLALIMMAVLLDE